MGASTSERRMRGEIETLFESVDSLEERFNELEEIIKDFSSKTAQVLAEMSGIRTQIDIIKSNNSPVNVNIDSSTSVEGNVSGHVATDGGTASGEVTG